MAPKCFKVREEEEGNEDLFPDVSVPSTVRNAYFSALLTAVSGGETISPLNTYGDYSTIRYEMAGGHLCKRQRCILNLRAKPAPQSIGF